MEVIDRLGASRGAVKYSEEHGGQYMALLEAVHQLHCLVSAELPQTIQLLMNTEHGPHVHMARLL